MNWKSLIENAFFDPALPQKWADLGCGSGVFTYALAELLPAGSSVIAVDAAKQELKHELKGIEINFIRADFEKDDLPLRNIDGILMANALHYIKNKQKLILKLEKYFALKKTFLIVEYDTMHANPWIPYPIDFENLKTLFYESGYSLVQKLGERNSVYRRKMYAALIQ